MPNPNHLPAGRPDGGQFTFAAVGGYIPGQIPWEYAEAPTSEIPPEIIASMYNSLHRVGIKDAQISATYRRLHPDNAKTPEEAKRWLDEVIRDTYFSNAATMPVQNALVVASDKYRDVINNGGQVLALANDDGSYQTVHTTNNSVSAYLNSIPQLKDGKAVVYNQRTGTLRRGAFCVPVGKPRKIAGTSVPRGRRNRATETARETPRRQAKVAEALNRQITSSASEASRALGSDDYAGRISVAVMKDKDGSLIIQDVILCESHEQDIAKMYAEELHQKVLKATRPDEILNPEVGDPSMLHTDDMHVVDSNFGGISAGVMNDTGRKSQITDAAAEQMFARHDSLRAERDKEYEKAYGHPRPTKTDEQREHERALDKKRRLRRKQAKIEEAAGREPIKVKGRGYLFAGEKGYEEAKDAAVRAEKLKADMLAKKIRRATSQAKASQTKRQTEKVSARDRKREQRARQKAIRQANRDGLRAVTYREDDSRSGKMLVAIEGSKEFEAAIKMRNIKLYEPKK